MGKVETNRVSGYKLSRLLNVVTENGTESRLKQMGRRMVTHNSVAVSLTNRGGYCVADLYKSAGHFADMHINSRRRFLSIGNLKRRIAVAD